MSKIVMSISADSPEELFSTILGAAKLINEDVPPAEDKTIQAAPATSAPASATPTPATSAPAPATPAPAPAVQQPVAPIQPPIAPPTVPHVPAAQVPVTAAPTHTMEQIAMAGHSLLEAGKMDELVALLNKYGAQAVTELKPEYYGAVATELRQMGAKI